jgi:hypothetical protein
MLNGNTGATDFEAVFTDRRARLPGADLGWLAELRESGINQFRRHGLPTPRSEAWKYTNLNRLNKVAFAAPSARATSVPPDQVPSLLPAGGPARRLVLVEGRFESASCRPASASSPWLRRSAATPAACSPTSVASPIRSASPCWRSTPRSWKTAWCSGSAAAPS